MKVVIVDGMNIAHIARHSGSVMTYKKQRTEVIKVSLAMIMRYIDIFEPDRLLVVWDGGRDLERMKLYPEYKQNRNKELTATEKIELKFFKEQVVLLKECLATLLLTQYEWVDREGDDYIYNIIKYTNLNCKDHPFEFTVVSSDKDFYQLLALFPNVNVFNPIKKTIVNRSNFDKEFGFPYSHYLDYKALVGDPSDNLPGVKGVGDAGAKILIEKVFANPDGDFLAGKKEKRYIDLLKYNFDIFLKMRKVIQFIDIEVNEILMARSEDICSMNLLQERGLNILRDFGFENWVENFNSFIQPFEFLLNKRSVGYEEKI